ncbi:MAG: biotin/lipoate A/B protein ligase family protein [Geothermobacteraceae bacterium]
MALDQALLEAVARGTSGPVLRLYRWQPATVTLGYAQRGGQVVNLEACQRRGFEVVRRCTGGRAVLHDREVTYAVIAPTGDGLFPHSVLASYRLIAEALADVYRGLGLDVILADQRHSGVHDDAAGRSACFTAPGQYELLYRGCKLAGCAQKRIPGAFLQHGSLPVDLDLEALYEALDTERRLTPAQGARLLAGQVGWINRWLEQPVAIETVEKMLVEACAQRFDIDFLVDEPTAEELRRAEALLVANYGNDSWNLQGIVEES